MDLETARYDSDLMSESDADLMHSAAYERQPAILTDTERNDFRNGELLKRVFILLGKHRGKFGKCYIMDFANLFELQRGLMKRYIFSIRNLTGLICIGDDVVNRNPKLTQYYGHEKEIIFSPCNISNDRDVFLNYNKKTTFLDGTSSAMIPAHFR